MNRFDQREIKLMDAKCAGCKHRAEKITYYATKTGEIGDIKNWMPCPFRYFRKNGKELFPHYYQSPACERWLPDEYGQVVYCRGDVIFTEETPPPEFEARKIMTLYNHAIKIIQGNGRIYHKIHNVWYSEEEILAIKEIQKWKGLVKKKLTP